MILWTRINLKSEKGSAMILALSVIFILTAFGAVSLMTSVANIQMSGRYRDWSKDYYALDMVAENKVKDINTQLELAETDAQNYMKGQYYLFANSSSLPTGDMQVISGEQPNIYSQWYNNVQPYLDDMNNTDNQNKQQDFLNATFQRLYYYYASYLLYNEGNTSLTYENDSSVPLSTYQNDLFDYTNQQVLNSGNLTVQFDTKNTIDPNSIKGKDVAVKMNVMIPTYSAPPTQMNNMPLQGNPIWTNAITAAGSIGFQGSGTSTINGDLFSADKDEFVGTNSLYLNDNNVQASGIYTNGQGVDLVINGNIYSKGNLHIFGNNSNSQINVNKYISNFNTAMKNNVFSNNGLFFDNDSTAYPPPTTDAGYPYIQQGLINPADTTLHFVNEDVSGGNIYCNSLSVDQGVSGGTINAAGNVSTFNDIKMNGTNLNALNSQITVAGNYIGINYQTSNGDPNASSTVINNTPLTGGEISLESKFIVPGIAFAQYTGVKPNGATDFTWSDHLYYSTGESITARNAAIYGAYMALPNHPYPGYGYVFDQYTNDPEPQQPYDVTNINSYYLMQANNTDGNDPNNLSVIPKISQSADYLSGKSVVSNVFLGSNVDGYSLGEALLHNSSTAPTATVYGPSFDDLQIPAPQLPAQPQSVLPSYALDRSRYFAFYSNLSKIFVAKVQNLGTVANTDNAGNIINTVKSVNADNIFKGFVDNSVVLNAPPGQTWANSVPPSNMSDAFVYMQPQNGSATLDLPANCSYSGIIYCAGTRNLSITGTGTFNGAIICEGNVTVSGTPTIIYDEGVIKTTLESNSNIRNFFAPGQMGGITYFSYTTPASDGAVRTDVKRYQVVEWKEEQN
ncbi:MAG: hypothetical protein P4L69_20520 [Desulfosporosinus sp.]|nr:hypothetical protein [Desulfosporosinus sp.]